MSTYHGIQGKFAAKTDNTVAYTDVDDTVEATITTGRDLIERWKMGDPDIQEILAGKKHPVEVTLRRHFKSGNFSSTGKSLAVLSQDGVVTYYAAFFPEGDASPKLLIGAGGFYDWHLGANLDGIQEETAKFKGKALAIT
jgi:hypothetical protein